MIISLRLFRSSTWDGDCCVSWVIGSGCEVGVRLVWILMTACVFIDSNMLLFILTAIYFVIFVMFLFISSLSSTIIDCR